MYMHLIHTENETSQQKTSNIVHVHVHITGIHAIIHVERIFPRTISHPTSNCCTHLCTNK